jgi:hypothetical protein
MQQKKRARRDSKQPARDDGLTCSGISPGEIVRATVTDASRDELLRAILDPLTLDWTIDGTSLRVCAPKK